MRRFFILLMIALLPLRSWAGDLMTLEMAVSQSAGVKQTTARAAPDCHSQNSTVSVADSVTESMSDPAGNPAKDLATEGRCDTCGMCQFCHSVAMANFSFSPLPSLAAPSWLSSDSTGFASAPRALSLKPPIS